MWSCDRTSGALRSHWRRVINCQMLECKHLLRAAWNEAIHVDAFATAMPPNCDLLVLDGMMVTYVWKPYCAVSETLAITRRVLVIVRRLVYRLLKRSLRINTGHYQPHYWSCNYTMKLWWKYHYPSWKSVLRSLSIAWFEQHPQTRYVLIMSCRTSWNCDPSSLHADILFFSQILFSLSMRVASNWGEKIEFRNFLEQNFWQHSQGSIRKISEGLTPIAWGSDHSSRIADAGIWFFLFRCQWQGVSRPHGVVAPPDIRCQRGFSRTNHKKSDTFFVIYLQN